ncbi:MAG: glycosyl hydrolase [Kiritimatiellia bacterium]
MQFGVAGNLWSDAFANTFRERKGYDLIPELPALFADIGRDSKIRLDYRDLVVALQEEGYFKPLFDWHQEARHDLRLRPRRARAQRHRVRRLLRTQRWNRTAPTSRAWRRTSSNCKVAARSAHLYNRPRVWLEGFYSSGWGTGSADVANATFANFAMGYNLLTLHGLYYSTHGGYWEWAPPCNHFHMPYWRHMGVFLECVQRLSYLMSQGDHRCDVAVMYPVEARQAGLDGDASVDAAFRTGGTLYGAGIDFDYMDTESLERAKVVDGQLRVSGEDYRALVIPSMRAVRFSTLQKAAELQRAGGLVIVLGAAPEASERAGRDDAALNDLVAGLTTRAADPAGVLALVTKAFPRDYTGPGKVNHRRVGKRDVYMIYDAPKGSECLFRATGKVELWNPWTGATSPLPVLAQDAAGTRLSLPLGEREPQLIVFSPGAPEIRPAADAPAPQTVAIEGDWEFELVPVLDNRFGDYHWPPTPALIGAEVRKLETTTGDPVRGPWRKVTCSFGPMFWKLGPLPDGFDDRLLTRLSSVDPSKPVEFGGKQYRWEPYEFSWRWGREGDPGHQGYHGLKNNVTDEFICLGSPRDGKNEDPLRPRAEGSRYYLWTSVPVASETQAHPRSGGLRPAAVWVNHQPAAASVQLKPGANPVLLRYDHPEPRLFCHGPQSRPRPASRATTPSPPPPNGSGIPANAPTAAAGSARPSSCPSSPRRRGSGSPTTAIPSASTEAPWAPDRNGPAHWRNTISSDCCVRGGTRSLCARPIQAPPPD